MPSQINPSQFEDGQPVSKSALRDTFSTIKGELEHGGFTRIATDVPDRKVSEKLNERLSVTDFGAKGDGVHLLDGGAITAASTTLTNIAADFTGRVGQTVIVMGAGVVNEAGSALVSTIVSVNSATSVTLAHSASTTVSDAEIIYGTDNATALVAMRNYCRLDNTKHYIIDFPRGYYLYTNNRFVANIGSAHLVGNGSRLQNITTSGWTGNVSPLQAQSIWLNFGDDATGEGAGTPPWPYEIGARFETAVAGDRTLTLLTTAEAATLTVGDRVLLHGYDQQFEGYPPNMRYFEWNIVSAVDTDTGVVSLETPIKDTYDQQWRPQAADPGPVPGVGPARILRLDRGAEFRYNEYIGLEQFTLSPNPLQDATQVGLNISADTLVMKDVKFSGAMWPSENRIAQFENCDLDDVEIDKICGFVEFDKCKIRTHLWAATGAMDLHVSRCSINSAIQVSPRNSRFEDNTIIVNIGQRYAAIAPFFVPHSTRSLVFKNNFIIHDGALEQIVDAGVGTTFSPSAIAAGNHIKLADNETNRTTIGRLDIGDRLLRVGTTEAQFVSRIYHDGTDFIIEAPWSSTITIADEFLFHSVQSTEISGNILRGPDGVSAGGWRQVLRNIRAYQLVGRDRQQRVVATIGDGWPDGQTFRTHNIYAFLHRLSVQVRSPYTGASANSNLKIFINGPDIAFTEIMQVRLDMRSYTEADIYGVHVTGTNAATQLNPATGVNDFVVAYENLAGTPEQMPRVTIEIEMTPFG